MKGHFSKLSKTEQKKVELKYHRMEPNQLDDMMSKAIRQTPNTIRLSTHLVKKLKTIAANEGEPEYQTMVKKWVEERVRQKASRSRKSTKRTTSARQNPI